jgi:hypothetical protein
MGMTEPQDLPPTAHEDEESDTPAAGVDAPSSPDVDVLDAQAPRLAGKRADERDAGTVDGSTPSFREG